MKKIFISNTTKFRIMDSVMTDEGVKIPVIYGKLSEAERQSEKGYRYKSTFWPKIIANKGVQDAIQSKRMLGMIEHPEDDNEYLSTPYEKASHVVLKVDVSDRNEPYGTFGLVNNEHGNAIKALAEIGVPIGVSTRGLGEFVSDAISEYVDEDNYGLITWDFTRNPNFSSLSMRKVTDSMMDMPLFRQVTEMLELRDSADTHYSEERLLKEIKDAEDELRAASDRYVKKLLQLRK